MCAETKSRVVKPSGVTLIYMNEGVKRHPSAFDTILRTEHDENESFCFDVLLWIVLELAEKSVPHD